MTTHSLCEIARGLLAAGALALAACGGSGGMSAGGAGDQNADCTDTTCGEVRVALTDADGDFLSYTVDVVSLKLEKANGAMVETLPVRQRVDFADLVDLTEFVTAATIPNGAYVGATVRLDYSNAEVTVESGGAPVAATVVDADGNPLGVVDMDVRLDNANRVVIAPGRPALLQLDFDLAATHTVDLSTTPATATADPVLVGSIEPVEQRDFRARGPLVSVNEAAGSYVVDLRPFNHPNARLGRFTVHTGADTDFEVDGEEFTGAAGLAALAAKGAGTPTVAHGVYDVSEREFRADEVLGGDSVPGAAFDVVIGNVAARSGNTLTVRGGTVIRTDDSVSFARGNIEVTIGDDTVVTQAGGGGARLGLEAISVGQRIHALGTADASTDSPTLDATAGRVRLHRTHLTGTVVSTVPGEMSLDLFSIDGRDPAGFDFSGTGMDASTDADPENYQVATGALDLGGLAADEPARAFGFVTPFGAAPPDFDASTLVDFSELRALLGVGWGFEGTSAPFLSMGADGFVIDGANPELGARHFIKLGPWVRDFTQFGTSVTVLPSGGDRTLYAVAQRFRVEVFRDFAPFADRVNALLNDGAAMRSLTARGAFDLGSTTLTANYVAVTFAP